MSNFKGFVTTDARLFNIIGGENRGASTKAMMRNGIKECPIDLRFTKELLDNFLDTIRMRGDIYMLVEGTLITRDWGHDLEDGSVICGTDVYILVEGFQIITGKKE